MGFFTTSVTGLKTVVTAIGAGVWGVINLLEGWLCVLSGYYRTEVYGRADQAVT